jgi:pantoate--beta-alanine ligase
MLLVRSRRDLERARSSMSEPVGAVLTMGALHEGHRRLVRTARERVGPSGSVVLTLFVNPLQFGPGEDLDRYPRTFDADVAAAEAEGVDLVFAPEAEHVYPDGSATITVDPGELGTVLEGAARPTHFRGVLTVVAKLLNLARPTLTVFGEKDYQQLVLVRRMCSELELGVEVVGMPTVREADGLALSSRNAYLSRAQRGSATALSQALRAGQDAAEDGVAAALASARTVLDTHADIDVDYLVVTGPDLGPAPSQGAARMLVAAQLGSTRLLDNAELSLGAAA